MIGHDATFADGERRRLLQVHILAGGDGGNCQPRMLMVGRRDEDGVDFLVGEEFFVVGVAGCASVSVPSFFV